MNIKNDITFEYSILRAMKKIRAVEEEIASRYSEGKMRCPTHLSIGQEAVPAVLSSFLDKDDLAVSTHRGHAHYLAKGGDLPAMIAEIYGKSTGCSKGKGGSMHLIDRSVGFMGTSAIVGNSIPIGVGLGFALQLEETKNLSVVYFGDGATEEGVYYECLNFAALHKLPVLFVCENNHYSVYSPKAVRQPLNRSISAVASAMGVKSFNLDGNNVVELIDKFSSLVTNIKNGGGPILVECETYRWREHCGPMFDDDLNYRPNKEIEGWRSRDPIKAYIEELMLTPAQIQAINNEIATEVNASFQFAEDSPFPDESEAMLGEFAK